MSKRPFAADTKVPADKTRLEIEALVMDAGAEAFGFAADGARAQIQFRLEGRTLRFDLPLPELSEDRFQKVHMGAIGWRPRTPTAARAAWEKACREQWRRLLLCIKAKLAAVDAGVVTFEEEFLAHVVMRDGRTVGDVVTQQLAVAHQGGESPRLLSDYTGGRT